MDCFKVAGAGVEEARSDLKHLLEMGFGWTVSGWQGRGWRRLAMI